MSVLVLRFCPTWDRTQTRGIAAEQEATVRLCFPQLTQSPGGTPECRDCPPNYQRCQHGPGLDPLHLPLHQSPEEPHTLRWEHKYTQDTRIKGHLLFLLIKSASTPVSGFSANLDRFGIEAKLQGGPRLKSLRYTTSLLYFQVTIVSHFYCRAVSKEPQLPLLHWSDRHGRKYQHQTDR